MEKSRSLIALLLLATAGYGQQEYHPLTHRPLADVSGGPQWLARPEREKEERPEQALDAIGVEKGSTVADVGCGPGYFTSRLARRVGLEGTVYGEDIQPGMLNDLVTNMRAQGLNNVKPVLGTETDPKLPKEAVDLIILVDVYHEFSHPQEMLRGMRESLKPNGRLVLLEYRAEDPKVMIRELHKMTVAQTRAELEPEGFRFDKSIEVLPQQHIIIFRR
jgi:ubiquinone/menaquinone biosynthesis C-methylase UbiE